jgi:hypothetical protein
MFQLSTCHPSVQQTSRGRQLTLDFPAAGLWTLGRPVWIGVLAFGLVAVAGMTRNMYVAEGPAAATGVGVVMGLLALGIVKWGLTFLGRAAATITVVAGEVHVREDGLLDGRNRICLASDIASLEVGDSSIGSGEDCPLRELQIRFANGRKLGVLRGRNETLLQETADRLRTILGSSRQLRRSNAPLG